MRVTVFLLALFFFSGLGSAIGLDTAAAEDSAAQGSGRLKYRSGPVCMCTGGLSERDIRRAQTRSLPNENPAESPGMMTRPETTVEPASSGSRTNLSE